MDKKKTISKLKQISSNESITYIDLLYDIQQGNRKGLDIEYLDIIVNNEINNFLLTELKQRVKDSHLNKLYDILDQNYKKRIKVSYERNKGVSEALYEDIFETLLNSKTSLSDDDLDIIIYDYISKIIEYGESRFKTN